MRSVDTAPPPCVARVELGAAMTEHHEHTGPGHSHAHGPASFGKAFAIGITAISDRRAYRVGHRPGT